jgi:beta-lactamase regulating signal transducer with metallopeptidase domain
MNPIAYCLIKIIICSAVLTAYYFVALRNKRFHKWNRFYLLLTVVFSISVPFLRIPLETAPESIVYALSQSETAMLSSNSSITSDYGTIDVQTAKSGVSWTLVVYLVGVCIVFAGMVISLFTIVRLKRKSTKTELADATLYFTDAESAPFSFFRNIFWRSDILPDTSEGRCILRHELHHIKARHSWDKMFMQIVLCALWFNPVFWIVRRELEMIHEFEADKASISDNDTSVLAAMILCTAYPQRQIAGMNQFFKSPVKRRLAMFTRRNRDSFDYARRLMVLPLAAIVFALWVFRAVAGPADETDTNTIHENTHITDMFSNDSSLISMNILKEQIFGNGGKTVYVKKIEKNTRNGKTEIVQENDTIVYHSGNDIITLPFSDDSTTMFMKKIKKENLLIVIDSKAKNLNNDTIPSSEDISEIKVSNDTVIIHTNEIKENSHPKHSISKKITVKINGKKIEFDGLPEFADSILMSGNNKIAHLSSSLTDSIEEKSPKRKFNVYRMTADKINYVSVKMHDDSAQNKGAINLNANVISTEQYNDTTKYVVFSVGTINNSHFSFLTTGSGKTSRSSNVQTFVINSDTLVLK